MIVSFLVCRGTTQDAFDRSRIWEPAYKNLNFGLAVLLGGVSWVRAVLSCCPRAAFTCQMAVLVCPSFCVSSFLYLNGVSREHARRRHLWVKQIMGIATSADLVRITLFTQW